MAAAARRRGAAELITDPHPTETKVHLLIPKDLLRQLDHLAIDSGLYRSELVVRLLREAVAVRSKEGEE